MATIDEILASQEAALREASPGAPRRATGQISAPAVNPIDLQSLQQQVRQAFPTPQANPLQRFLGGAATAAVGRPVGTVARREQAQQMQQAALGALLQDQVMQRQQQAVAERSVELERLRHELGLELARYEARAQKARTAQASRAEMEKLKLESKQKLRDRVRDRFDAPISDKAADSIIHDTSLALAEKMPLARQNIIGEIQAEQFEQQERQAQAALGGLQAAQQFGIRMENPEISALELAPRLASEEAIFGPLSSLAAASPTFQIEETTFSPGGGFHLGGPQLRQFNPLQGAPEPVITTDRPAGGGLTPEQIQEEVRRLRELGRARGVSPQQRQTRLSGGFEVPTPEETRERQRRGLEAARGFEGVPTAGAGPGIAPALSFFREELGPLLRKGLGHLVPESGSALELEGLTPAQRERLRRRQQGR